MAISENEERLRAHPKIRNGNHVVKRGIRAIGPKVTLVYGYGDRGNGKQHNKDMRAEVFSDIKMDGGGKKNA